MERVSGRVVRVSARVRDSAGTSLGRVLRVDLDGVVALRRTPPSARDGGDLALVRRCLGCGSVHPVPTGSDAATDADTDLAAGRPACGAAPTALVAEIED